MAKIPFKCPFCFEVFTPESARRDSGVDDSGGLLVEPKVVKWVDQEPVTQIREKIPTKGPTDQDDIGDDENIGEEELREGEASRGQDTQEKSTRLAIPLDFISLLVFEVTRQKNNLSRSLIIARKKGDKNKLKKLKLEQRILSSITQKIKDELDNTGEEMKFTNSFGLWFYNRKRGRLANTPSITSVFSELVSEDLDSVLNKFKGVEGNEIKIMESLRDKFEPILTFQKEFGKKAPKNPVGEIFRNTSVAQLKPYFGFVGQVKEDGTVDLPKVKNMFLGTILFARNLGKNAGGYRGKISFKPELFSDKLFIDREYIDTKTKEVDLSKLFGFNDKSKKEIAELKSECVPEGTPLHKYFEKYPDRFMQLAIDQEKNKYNIEELIRMMNTVYSLTNEQWLREVHNIVRRPLEHELQMAAKERKNLDSLFKKVMAEAMENIAVPDEDSNVQPGSYVYIYGLFVNHSAMLRKYFHNMAGRLIKEKKFPQTLFDSADYELQKRKADPNHRNERWAEDYVNELMLAGQPTPDIFFSENNMEKTASLDKYKEKREFDETPEPEGKEGDGKNKYRFVIQDHKADKSGHHWDLRLENDEGTMSSWAIPKHKFPSGKAKLLAVKTEDHPLEYRTFEGEIPSGYGKGYMDIHDSGTYEEIESSPSKIVFRLKGNREMGTYNLFNIDGSQWLIMEHKKKTASRFNEIYKLAVPSDGKVLQNLNLQQLKKNEPPPGDKSQRAEYYRRISEMSKYAPLYGETTIEYINDIKTKLTRKQLKLLADKLYENDWYSPVYNFLINRSNVESDFIDWLIKVYDEVNPIQYVEDSLYYIHDAFRLNEDFANNLPRLSFFNAEHQAGVAHEMLDGGGYEGEVEHRAEIIKEYDNMRFVKLTTKDQLNEEGEMMGHCVESYYDDLEKGTEIYSLRDSRGPHVTFEVRGNKVHQIKGKQNTSPVEKYFPVVRKIIMNMNWNPLCWDFKDIGWGNTKEEIDYLKEYAYKMFDTDISSFFVYGLNEMYPELERKVAEKWARLKVMPEIFGKPTYGFREKYPDLERVWAEMLSTHYYKDFLEYELDKKYPEFIKKEASKLNKINKIANQSMRCWINGETGEVFHVKQSLHKDFLMENPEKFNLTFEEGKLHREILEEERKAQRLQEDPDYILFKKPSLIKEKTKKLEDLIFTRWARISYFDGSAIGINLSTNKTNQCLGTVKNFLRKYPFLANSKVSLSIGFGDSIIVDLRDFYLTTDVNSLLYRRKEVDLWSKWGKENERLELIKKFSQTDEEIIEQSKTDEEIIEQSKTDEEIIEQSKTERESMKNIAEREMKKLRDLGFDPYFISSASLEINIPGASDIDLQIGVDDIHKTSKILEEAGIPLTNDYGTWLEHTYETEEGLPVDVKIRTKNQLEYQLKGMKEMLKGPKKERDSMILKKNRLKDMMGQALESGDTETYKMLLKEYRRIKLELYFKYKIIPVDGWKKIGNLNYQ